MTTICDLLSFIFYQLLCQRMTHKAKPNRKKSISTAELRRILNSPNRYLNRPNWSCIISAFFDTWFCGGSEMMPMDYRAETPWNISGHKILRSRPESDKTNRACSQSWAELRQTVAFHRVRGFIKSTPVTLYQVRKACQSKGRERKPKTPTDTLSDTKSKSQNTREKTTKTSCH